MLKKYKPRLAVGSLDTKPKEAAPKPAAPAAPKKAEPAKDATAVAAPKEPLEPFGDMIPYADPSWYQGVSRIPPHGLPADPPQTSRGIPY